MIARRGFTLLEMLLATALTVVLMGSVMAVVIDLSKPVKDDRALTDADADSQVPAEPWVAMLRDDIRNADEVFADADGALWLAGYLALDGERRQTHRPAEVRYALVAVGGRKWLVRSQRRLDVVTNERDQIDLVCAGVDRFEVLADDEPLDEGQITFGSRWLDPEQAEEDATEADDDAAVDGDDPMTTTEQREANDLVAREPDDPGDYIGRFMQAPVPTGGGRISFQTIDMANTAAVARLVDLLNQRIAQQAGGIETDELRTLKYYAGALGHLNQRRIQHADEGGSTELAATELAGVPQGLDLLPGELAAQGGVRQTDWKLRFWRSGKAGSAAEPTELRIMVTTGAGS